MKRKRTKSFNSRIVAAQALFYINTLIWLGFAVYMFYDMAAVDNNGFAILIISIFMLGNAGAMFLSGFMLGKRQKWIYYFAIAFLGINIFLTFTDQFGIYDLLTLIIDLVLLVILFSIGRTYLSQT